METESGVISSPGFNYENPNDGFYINNQQCTWKIISPDSQRSVNLLFDSYNLSDSKDYVKVSSVSLFLDCTHQKGYRFAKQKYSTVAGCCHWMHTSMKSLYSWDFLNLIIGHISESNNCFFMISCTNYHKDRRLLKVCVFKTISA